jgi:hypothetical protein
MTLSILIPTLPERSHLLDRLMNCLSSQAVDGIQISTLSDDGWFNIEGNNTYSIRVSNPSIPNQYKGWTTGAKRNELVRLCTTDYAAFIDDDDIVATDYIESIMEGISKGVDCITFNGQIIFDRTFARNFSFRIGYPYDPKFNQALNMYRRPPTHLCAIKTEILRQFPFPDITRGEDYQQCLEMQKAGALKTEHHINKTLYYYYYTRKPKDAV